MSIPVIILMSTLGLRQTQFFSALVKRMQLYRAGQNSTLKIEAIPDRDESKWIQVRDRLMAAPIECWVDQDYKKIEIGENHRK